MHQFHHGKPHSMNNSTALIEFAQWLQLLMRYILISQTEFMRFYLCYDGWFWVRIFRILVNNLHIFFSCFSFFSSLVICWAFFMTAHKMQFSLMSL